MTDLPVTKEAGQRALDLPWVNRVYPVWAQPSWQKAEFWRLVVQSLPYAQVFKESMISYLTTLEWKIEPRDSNMRDELKSEIEYYTRLFEHGGNVDSGKDFVWLLDWVLSDYLDIPFGGAVELIRYGDWKNGKIAKIIPLDGATLSPTLNKDFPVIQKVMQDPTHVVNFPAHAINRLYMSPRTDIRREGWGYPPPEKIFLAIEMLRRGDAYYAGLLVDTPEAGLLDLGNMSKKSATEWIKAFKDLYTGIDGFKIPVLYEHTVQAKWIPFGKPPTDLMYDRITLRYAALTGAGYGMTLSDIGLGGGSNGGETLSGTIRDERKTKRGGLGKNKRSVQYFFDRMLPKSLQFRFIDLDDEQSVALGRARLANATAFNQYSQMGVFSPTEIRMQTIADGLITIGIPEEPPEDAAPEPKVQERPGMLGSPVSPSQGGQGEVRNALHQALLDEFSELSDVQLLKLASKALPWLIPEVDTVFNELSVHDFDEWNEWHNDVLWGNLKEDIPEFTALSVEGSTKELTGIILSEEWFSEFKPPIDELVEEFQKKASEVVLEKRKQDYILGKSTNVNKDIVIDTSEFRTWVVKYFEDFNKNLVDTVSKVAVSATRKALIRMGKVGILDNAVEIGDNTAVDIMLAYLVVVSKTLADEYAEQMVDKLIELIGD